MLKLASEARDENVPAKRADFFIFSHTICMFYIIPVNYNLVIIRCNSLQGMPQLQSYMIFKLYCTVYAFSVISVHCGEYPIIFLKKMSTNNILINYYSCLQLLSRLRLEFSLCVYSKHLYFMVYMFMFTSLWSSVDECLSLLDTSQPPDYRKNPKRNSSF